MHDWTHGIKARQRVIREQPERYTEDERAWAEHPATAALARGDTEEAARIRRELAEPEPE